jgi:hypothetical protein
MLQHILEDMINHFQPSNCNIIIRSLLWCCALCAREYFLQILISTSNVWHQRRETSAVANKFTPWNNMHFVNLEEWNTCCELKHTGAYDPQCGNRGRWSHAHERNTTAWLVTILLKYKFGWVWCYIYKRNWANCPCSALRTTTCHKLSLFVRSHPCLETTPMYTHVHHKD